MFGLASHDYNLTAYFGDVNYTLKGTKALTIAGDVTMDGTVNILDQTAVNIRMGKKSTDSDWITSLSDAIDKLLYPDGKIDILDMTIVSKQYGKSAP